MLTPFAKLALGPLLLAQGRRLRRTALRLPEAEGARTGEVGAGERTLRVLFVGDSSAAGVGVAAQAQALAEPAARRLAALTGARVTWQLVARSGVNTAEARALVRSIALQPADLLVTALGVNDVTSQRTPRQFLSDMRALWCELQQATGVRAWVASGLPPLHALPVAPQPLRWYLGRCAQQLDRALRRWIEQLPAARFCSLQWAKAAEMADDGFHPGPRQYAEWSCTVAELAAQLVDKQTSHHARKRRPRVTP